MPSLKRLPKEMKPITAADSERLTEREGIRGSRGYASIEEFAGIKYSVRIEGAFDSAVGG